MNEIENEVKRAKREYQRQWRKNNPEKVKKIQERYWLKKANESGGESFGENCNQR